MVMRNVLHPHLVKGDMFVVTRIVRLTLRLGRFDNDRGLLEALVLHCIDFQFMLASVTLTRRHFPVRLALR